MPVLQFKGKTAVESYHHTVPHHILEFDGKLSVLGKGEKPNMDSNLIIEGDNLLALKALLPTHAGQIKCIYIDPPYNTGDEGWIFRDNLTQPQFKEWIGKEVGREGEDATRHDKWCCMMYPRLHLLKELLSNDGAIFISIDDNEVYHLRMIMNEIFGEENFIAQFTWNTEGHTDNQFHVKVNHEYVILYAKNSSKVSLGHVVDPSTRKESNLWKGFAENSITKNGPGNPPSEIKLPVGFPCTTDVIDLEPSTAPAQFFAQVESQGFITREMTKKFSITYPIRKDRMICKEAKLFKECRVYSGWANVNKLKAFIQNQCQPVQDDDGFLTFYLSERGVIYYKKQREKARNILSVLRNMGTTEQMRSELERMGIVSQYPKPKELIKYLIKIGLDDGGIVLDSFAGSGTTGHSVLELNKEDGGNRRFILVFCEISSR